MTSDMTFSFFTGDLLVLFAAHKAASFGIMGESCRAKGESAVPIQYGVVTYRHGWLDIAADLIFFDRLIMYHTFYKQVLAMGLTKNTLLKSPTSLTFRFLTVMMPNHYVLEITNGVHLMTQLCLKPGTVSCCFV